MPIPKPAKGEKEEKFIGRCMGNPTMEKEYPKNVQRLGVCYSGWRKVHGGKPPAKKESFIMKILRKFKRVKKETTETTRAKPRYQFGTIVVFEAFLSLRKELEQAVQQKFGKKSYVSDFSNKEVVVGFDRDAALGPSYQTDKYKKITYKLTKGEVEFVGEPQTVERLTTYENKLETADLVCLVDMERQLKKALSEKKDGEV